MRKFLLSLLAIVPLCAFAAPAAFPPPYQRQAWTTNSDAQTAALQVLAPGNDITLTVDGDQIRINSTAVGGVASNIISIKAGTNVTVITNGLEVTISADVSSLRVTSATNVIWSAVTSGYVPKTGTTMSANAGLTNLLRIQPNTGTFAIGNASANYLTLSASGNFELPQGFAGPVDALQIETSEIPLARGGTGNSLVDPGANKVLGWDDTDSLANWWTLGPGLTYTHASHTLDASINSSNYLYGITPFREPTRLVFFGSSLTGGNAFRTYPNHLTNYFLPMTNVTKVDILATGGQTIAQLDTLYWPTVTALAPASGTNCVLFYWGTLNDLYQGATPAALFGAMSNDWFRAKVLGYTVITMTLLDIPYTRTAGSGFTPLTVDLNRRAVNAMIRSATNNYHRLIDAEMLLQDYSTSTFDGAHTSQDAANLLAKEVARVLSLSEFSPPNVWQGVVSLNNVDGIDLLGPMTASLFTGSGAGLTALNGTQITTGTVQAGRMPAFAGGDVTSSLGSVVLSIGANRVNGTMLALGSDARGDVMFYNGTDWARRAPGTAGQVLTTQGAGADPTWTTALGGTNYWAEAGGIVRNNQGLAVQVTNTFYVGDVIANANIVLNTDGSATFLPGAAVEIATSGTFSTPGGTIDAGGDITANGNLIASGGDVKANTGGFVMGATTVNLTANNQVVDTTAYASLKLSSDSGTAGDRTIVLTAADDGKIIRLTWVDTDAGQLVDNQAQSGGGTTKLTSTWTPTADDIITLLGVGTDWVEVSRSAN